MYEIPYTANRYNDVHICSPISNKEFYEERQKCVWIIQVCRNSYLLFHVSGVMVAYVVVNFCSHVSTREHLEKNLTQFFFTIIRFYICFFFKKISFYASLTLRFFVQIFEIAVCMIWSKKTNPTPKINPTVNGAPNQLNDVEISEYEDIA